MPLSSKEELKHHAYLLESAGSPDLAEIKKKLEEKFLTEAGPADWFMKSLQTFGIEDSRELKEIQSRKGFGVAKIFLIKADFFTTEAQNALLKVFEEPTEGTHIFLAVPKTARLLPTLRSRLFSLDISIPASGMEEVAEKFLKSPASERLKTVRKIAENKDKSAAVSLLNSLEEKLRKDTEGVLSPEKIFILEEIGKGRVYLNGRAASIKMILEHISLILPVKEQAS